MTNKLYIARSLYDGDKTYSESELLATSNYIVVLAEPGAGKTDLLGSLASQLQTESISASRFKYQPNGVYRTLVLDAFDEVSRIDQGGVFELFAKAQSTGVDRVVVSSRSGEWDSSYTHHFTQFFGNPPAIVRLHAFTTEEQKRLFDDHVEDEDFFEFRNEVGRFDLDMLLPNPKFLQLFADAYVESDRCFSDKTSIFKKAIEHLAKEVNPGVSQRRQVTLEKKIEFANEVFAKLLLSGSEGVAVTDASTDRLYPNLSSLVKDYTSLDCILDTRLFKPGYNHDQHQPVHKIVAEYCAARYLTKRIVDASDSFSLPQCMAIVAPNSIVRDELRGLLGWMAALGNESLQKTAITLDPYAVLANGDPSQLPSSSKQLLLKKLVETAQENPNFRRGDIWRTFSAAGFFTREVVDQARELLTEIDESGDLKGLILQLLANSPAASYLVEELHQLMFDQENGFYIRSLASNCLLELQDHDHHKGASRLISEGSEASLKIAANILKVLGSEKVGNTFFLELLRSCAHLYPKCNQHERTYGTRHFIKGFISILDLSSLEWLLDALTVNLSCICGKVPYKCECRIGVSKIAGVLIDRYFEFPCDSHDPVKIWGWVKNLNFNGQTNAHASRSVDELERNDDLRQGIIKLAFENETDPDRIRDIQHDVFGLGGFTHSGLQIKSQDLRFIADLAFETDNISLWSCFMIFHYHPQSEDQKGTNILRRHMRQQARKKNTFLQEWTRRNKIIEKYRYEDRKNRLPHTRGNRRLRKKQADQHLANIKFVNENRELVESGNHGGCLVRFAELTLQYPDQIETEFGDVTLVKNALKNCLNFIESEIPTLRELAALQCASNVFDFNASIILYAACLEIFRSGRTLNQVPNHMLEALRTNNMHWHAVTGEEQSALMAEVDRLLFTSVTDAENFVRTYIEPQLVCVGYDHPQVNWLEYINSFKPLQETIPIEWLQRYPNMPLNAQSELFEMAAQNGDRIQLEEIIRQRNTILMSDTSNQRDDDSKKQERVFWLVRAFYFLPNIPDTHWDWLVSDRKTILALKEPRGTIGYSDSNYWPILSAQKIELVLNAFIGSWPKVTLPSTHGSDSPMGEKAYRFMTNVIWKIDQDNPDYSLPVLNRLIDDPRFSDFVLDLRSIRATVIRERALRDFEAPSSERIVALLDEGDVVTVEGLRVLLLEELEDYQADLDGSETTTKDIFYEKDERIGEVKATLRIAERIRLRLENKSITITPEHQLKDAKRSDFTCSKTLEGQRRLLVVEVKGQWHSELYTAAAEQLHERYSIHPDAEQQGVYLVLWFGKSEKIANRKNTKIKTAHELKHSIEISMPEALRSQIDVFVLDVSLEL